MTKTAQAWNKKFASLIGIISKRYGMDISWSHDPEDRYGGFVVIKDHGVPVHLNFDEERMSLELHYPYSYDYYGEYTKSPVEEEERYNWVKTDLTTLETDLKDFCHKAYLAHRKMQEQARKQQDEDEANNKAKTTELAEKMAAERLSGVAEGKVLESGGFTSIVSVHDSDFNLAAKEGERVWVLRKISHQNQEV